MTLRTEIETRLKVWADAQSPVIPIAYQNVKFNKPLSGSYLEVVLLGHHGKSSGLSASGVTRTGIFQINCYSSLNTGMAQVETLAESVVSLFPVVPKTGTVSIEAPLSWSGSYVEDTFVCVPVRARYRIEM
jgi:hypothetical protein